MKAWIKLCGVVMALSLAATLPVAFPATASEIPYKLTNNDAREFRYWAQITRIHEREASLRERISSSSRVTVGGAPRRYDFEGYVHLRPAFLLYAAEEGAEHARKVLEGESKAIIDRQVYENVSLAFQYYPIIAATPEHYQDIIDALRNRRADPVLRLYIAEQLAAEPHHYSLLQRYLREHMRNAPENSISLLRRLSQDPLEEHPIQRAAMRGLFNFIYLSIQRAINDDTPLQSYLSDEADAVTPKALVQYPDAPLEEDTQELIADLEGTMHHFVDICIAHLRPEAKRPTETRELALEYLVRIKEEMPYPEKEKIREALTEHS